MIPPIPECVAALSAEECDMKQAEIEKLVERLVDEKLRAAGIKVPQPANRSGNHVPTPPRQP